MAARVRKLFGAVLHASPPLYAHAWRRFVKNDSVIKLALRELYKKVHPDLFHQFPEAKAANEQSFKLLQEYLEALSSKSAPVHPGHRPYKFEFHVWQSVASGTGDGSGVATLSEEDNASVMEDPSESLQVVKLTLSPPKPHHAPQFPDLSRLLAACGVPLAAALPPDRALNLRAFLPGAAERVLAAPPPAPDALRTLCSALELARQVRVEVLPSADRGAALCTLRALAAALGAGEEGAALRGLTLVLGREPGAAGVSSGAAPALDGRGRVVVAVLEDSEAAAQWLRSADFGAAREALARRREEQGLERRAAAALGVGSVGRLGGEGRAERWEYREFLEALLADAGPGASGAPSAVHVLAVSPRWFRLRGAESRDSLGKGPYDPATVLEPGELVLSASLRPPALQHWLARLRPRAETRAAQREAAAARLASLRRVAERALRLRRVAAEPGLGAHRFEACLRRLVRDAAELQPLVGGLALAVGETSGVAPDCSRIIIPWDYVL